MPQRVVLFIDNQNTYKCAREAFHDPNAALSHYGQFKPLQLAQRIIGKDQPPGDRELAKVRVYAGRPSQERDPQGYRASRRQIAAWERAGNLVFPRTLKYPPGYPAEKPREKGVDVQLAIDFVAGATDGDFDVGIIFSTDTDLIPAIEFVLDRPILGVTAEVAAWWAPGANPPLKVRGVWQHRLDDADYQAVRDWRAYAR